MSRELACFVYKVWYMVIDGNAFMYPAFYTSVKKYHNVINVSLLKNKTKHGITMVPSHFNTMALSVTVLLVNAWWCPPFLSLYRSGSVLKTPQGSWGCLNAKAWPVCPQCGSHLYPASNHRFIFRAWALMSAWTLSLKPATVNLKATAHSPRINCSPKRVSTTRYTALLQTHTQQQVLQKKIIQDAFTQLFCVPLLPSSGGKT